MYWKSILEMYMSDAATESFLYCFIIEKKIWPFAFSKNGLLLAPYSLLLRLHSSEKHDCLRQSRQKNLYTTIIQTSASIHLNVQSFLAREEIFPNIHKSKDKES